MFLPTEALATMGRRLASEEHGLCALGVLTSRSAKESGSSAEMQKTAEAQFQQVIGSSLSCIQYIVFTCFYMNTVK